MCKDQDVARLPRSAGPVGIALTAYDVWRRIPKQQRRQILEQVRRHGPTVAVQAVKSARAIRRTLRQPE